MVGITDWMTSPSSSSTSRSTPCVLGCCGPMLMVIVSVRSSAISSRGIDEWTNLRLDEFIVGFDAPIEISQSNSSRRPCVNCSVSSLHSIPLDVGAEFPLADFHRFVRLRGLPDLHRIILPSRVPLPVIGHQQPAQVG